MAQAPSINFISVLILIGAVQGLFLACALVLMHRGNRRANLILAALLLTMSVLLIDGFMNITNYYSRYHFLLGMAWPANFLMAPFVYFYVRELSSSRKTVFSWTQLLHFLPVTVSSLLIAYHISAYGKAPEWASACALMEGAQIHARDIAISLVGLHKLVYYIFAFLLITAYSSRIKQSFSSLDKISLAWLRTLMLLFFSLFIVFAFAIFFILYSVHLGIQREIVYLLYLGTAVITSVMAFKGLLQPEIFLQIEIANLAELIRTGQNVEMDAPSTTADVLLNGNGTLPKGKYQKSYLANDRAAEIARKLLQLMDIEKLFLKPELTLSELADRLSVSANDLSQVINREMNKSFFDFVNEYRVREAKKLLSSPKYSHFSILGIALDAGFNSKSAFYTAFSKYNGTTPSGFRKQFEFAEHSAESNLQGRA